MERHKPTVFSSSIRGYSLLEDALDVLLVEDSRSDAELIIPIIMVGMLKQ